MLLGILQKMAAQCNRRKLNAKKASEQSDLLYLCMFVRDSNNIKTKATLLDMGERSFEVVCLEYGVDIRFRCDQSSATARND